MGDPLKCFRCNRWFADLHDLEHHECNKPPSPSTPDIKGAYDAGFQKGYEKGFKEGLEDGIRTGREWEQ